MTRLGLEGFTSGLAVMLGRMEMPVGLSYALTWLSPDGLNDSALEALNTRSF